MTTPFRAGLIGVGLAGSHSPALHEREAAALGLPCHYTLIGLDTTDRDVETLIAEARTAGWQGLNVTHPAKRQVIPHLDALAPDAAAIGAVNTIVFGPDGVVGHNTDWSGFARGLTTGMPDGLTSDDLAEVVLVGAGGAGAAVGHALLALGVRTLHVVDTAVDRARALAGELHERFPDRVADHAAQVDHILRRSTGLVQATPVGMTGHPGLPFDPGLLHDRLWVADLIYRPLETELLAAARALGCRTLNGGRMLVFQAADAFALFTGHTPDAERMLAHFHQLVGTTTGDHSGDPAGTTRA